MTILFSIAMLIAADGSALPPDFAANPPSMETVAKRAAEDPEGYREVLTICAAYHGALAARPSDTDAASVDHEGDAIMFLTAAGLVPLTNMDKVTEAYTEKVLGFVSEHRWSYQRRPGKSEAGLCARRAFCRKAGGGCRGARSCAGYPSIRRASG